MRNSRGVGNKGKKRQKNRKCSCSSKSAAKTEDLNMWRTTKRRIYWELASVNHDRVTALVLREQAAGRLVWWEEPILVAENYRDNELRYEEVKWNGRHPPEEPQWWAKRGPVPGARSGSVSGPRELPGVAAMHRPRAWPWSRLAGGRWGPWPGAAGTWRELDWALLPSSSAAATLPGPPPGHRAAPCLAGIVSIRSSASEALKKSKMIISCL